MNNHEKMFEDPVERAAEALRSTPVPAEPSEELLKATIARVERGGAGKSGDTSKRGWWSMKMVRRTAVAAGLAVLVGGGVLVGVLGGGARVAFADVIEQVKQAQAVRCKVTLETKGHTSTVNMLMTDSGVMVVSGPGVKIVMNPKEGKMLTLTQATMQALLVDTKQSPEQAAATALNLLEMFRQLSPDAGKALGEKKVEGHALKGFSSVLPNGMNVEVWADQTTQMPVTVSLDASKNAVFVTGIHYSFQDFDWSPKVDPAETSMEIPAGYKVASSVMNMTNLKEEDVSKMLQAAADMNNGILPDSIDTAGIIKVATGWTKTQPRSGDTSQMMQQMTEKMAPMARAWAFIGDTTKGTGWRYDGQGVRIGEKGKAVAWYKPTGSEKWRVMDADMNVHEEAKAPEGGAEVKIMNGMPGFADTQPAGAAQTMP